LSGFTQSIWVLLMLKALMTVQMSKYCVLSCCVINSVTLACMVLGNCAA